MGEWSEQVGRKWAARQRAKAERARALAEDASAQAAEAVANRGAKELDAADHRSERIGAYFEGTEEFDEEQLIARTKSILNTTADSYQLAGEDRVRGSVFSVAANMTRIAELGTDLQLSTSEAVRAAARLLGLSDVDPDYEGAPADYQESQLAAAAKPTRIPQLLVVMAALAVFFLELLPTKWFLTNRLTLASGSDSDVLVWLISAVIAVVLTGAMLGAGLLWAESSADRSKRGAALGFVIVAVALQMLSFSMRITTESEESGAKGALLAIAVVAFCGAMLLMVLEYLSKKPAPLKVNSAVHAGTHYRVVDQEVTEVYYELQKVVKVHLPSAVRNTQLARMIFDEEELVRLSGAARDYGAVHEKVVSDMLGEIRAAREKLETQDMNFDAIDLEKEAMRLYGHDSSNGRMPPKPRTTAAADAISLS